MAQYKYGLNLEVRAASLRAQFPKERILEDVYDAQSEAIEGIEKLVWTFIDKNFGQQNYSLSELARMGHPYSVRRRKGVKEPDWVINKQSGAFYRGFAVEVGVRVQARNGREFAALVVQNHNSKARVLQDGNGRMRPRAWQIAMKQEFMTNFYGRLNNDLKRILRMRFYNPRKSRSIAST